MTAENTQCQYCHLPLDNNKYCGNCDHYQDGDPCECACCLAAAITTDDP